MLVGSNECGFISKGGMDFCVWNDKSDMENLYLELCEAPSEFLKRKTPDECVLSWGFKDCVI
jgi:hypothetical protein